MPPKGWKKPKGLDSAAAIRAALPETPAGRIEMVQELVAPRDEHGAPQPDAALISIEDAKKALEASPDYLDVSNIISAYKRRELTNLDVAKLTLERIEDVIALCEQTQMPMAAIIQLNASKRCIVGRIREKEFGFWSNRKPA